MRTSSIDLESAEPSLGASHPTQMDLGHDQNQIEPEIPPSHPTMSQTWMDGTTPEPKAKKLTMAERLDRIFMYRFLPTEIEFTEKQGGIGGYAEVVRANLIWGETYSEPVAVKKLLFSESTDDEKLSKEFVHEVEVLAKLEHKNIVKLMGFVEDLTHREAWILLSWEPNGNVREFLASGEWEIPERISLIQDTFQGLEYLHTQKPPICHGDLKSRRLIKLNILVNSSYRAVITDFGSSRFMDEEERKASREDVQDASRVSSTDNSGNHEEVTIITSASRLALTGPAWTLRWAAPELLIEDIPPDLASDIWSAGWVCWEIMTNKVPFEEDERHLAVTLKVIHGAVPITRDEGQLAQIIALCSLMKDCWNFKREDRPKAAQCYKEVNWMPSTPPLGGTLVSSGTKEPSPRLLLEMGILHFSQVRYEEATSLLGKVVANAKSPVDPEVAEALYWLGGVYRTKSNYTEAEEIYKRAKEIYAHIGDDQGRAHTAIGLAEVYRPQCKYTQAEESYTQAQDIYACVGDSLGRANAEVGLGHVYYDQCKYPEAEESFARAQEIFARMGEYLGQANAVLGLGRAYRARCKYTEAEESCHQAQEVYARIGSDQGQANALLLLGDIAYAQCKYAEAREAYTRAQEISVRIGNALDQAHVLDGLGDIYRAQCKLSEAEESYAKAQKIHTRIGHDEGQANTMDGLGDIYRLQCKYAEAEECYAQAQEIFDRIDSAAGRANTALGLARTYSDQSKNTEAEESYTRAQEIYTQIGDDQGRGKALDGLGDICRAQSKYTEAEELYTRAQEIHARLGNDLGRADTELGLGHVYRAQSKDTEAEESYNRAQETYTRLGNDLGRANALRGLGHLYWEQYRGIEAARFYTEARDLYSKVGDFEDMEDAASWLARC